MSAVTFAAAQVLRLLPRTRITRAVGRLADARVPASVASAVVRLYARAYDVDMDEAVLPDQGFDSFDAFFTRTLRVGQRPMPSDERVVVSPADGKIESFGPVVARGHFSVKGRPYRAEQLVGDEEEARRYEGGQFCVVYLSPRDYHRVHAPVDGQVSVVRSFHGDHYPVNAIGERHVKSLFAINRRVSIPIDSPHHGRVTVVLVGAMVVGRITTPFVEGRDVPLGAHPLQPPREVRRGDEIGIFHLGSTAVVFFEPRVPTLTITPGPIRYGAPLTPIAGSSSPTPGKG
jgi:phosphatidylserine decarboxylase